MHHTAKGSKKPGYFPVLRALNQYNFSDYFQRKYLCLEFSENQLSYS